MSHDAIAEILQNRQKFTTLLQHELAKIDRKISETTSTIDSLKCTKSCIAELATKVEHEALIPLGKRIFVPGVITHPGEYFIDHQAHPNAYTTVETYQDTVRVLERKIERQQEILQAFQGNREQLEEKIQTLTGSANEDSEQIVSDRGVALKVGDFYEILEYED